MKTATKLRDAFIAKSAALAKEKHPHLTPSQALAIGARTASRVGNWSESLLTNSEQILWLTDGEISIDRSLIRRVPSAETLQAHREGEYVKAHKIERCPVEIRLQISREISAADDEARLAMVPYESVKEIEARPITEVEKLDARAKKSTQSEDDEFLRRMGVDPYKVLPLKRKALLDARNAQPDGLRRAARELDVIAMKDEDRLSPQERISRFRAQQALDASKRA